MKKGIYLALAIMVLVLAHAVPSEAHGHFRGSVWIGPVWGPGWWGPTYPYPYYSYPYYQPPAPVIIEQRPQEYIQQPAPEQQQQYWYFCPDPQGYYPQMKSCPKGWMRVVPTPPGERKEPK